MNLNKCSYVLRNIMLAIFILLLGGSVLLQAVRFQNISYILSFILAAAIFAAALFLFRRNAGEEQPCGMRRAFISGAVLTAVFILVNLLWVLFIKDEPYGDYLCFLNAAKDLAAGGELTNRSYLALFPHILGYSTFLSGCIRLFGCCSMLAPLMNLLLTTVSGVLIYVLLMKTAGYRAAVTAYLLWIFCPSKGLYNTLMLSEPLYTCLILAFLLLVLSLRERILMGGSLWLRIIVSAFFGGLLLASVNAVRPVGAIPLIACLIWILLLRGDRMRDGARWIRWGAFALIMVLSASLFGSLWNRHLKELLHEEPASVPGYSIYVGLNSESGGTFYFPDMDDLAKAYEREGSAAAAQDFMLEKARERYESGSIDFGSLIKNKLRVFMGNDEGGAFSTHFSLSDGMYKFLLILSNVFYYFLVLLCLGGAVKFMRSRNLGPILMAYMYVIGLCLAHMIVEVQGRYHYSIIPMLIISAALFTHDFSLDIEIKPVRWKNLRPVLS